MRALQGAGVSAARACELVGYTRSNLYYRRKSKGDELLKGRLQELATERPRWGWRRLLILLHREGVQAGEHRIRRVYRELGLQVRPRKKRKVRYVRGVLSRQSRPPTSVGRWTSCTTRLPVATDFGP